jgi:hypothetical protein
VGAVIVERVGWRSAPRVLGLLVAWGAWVDQHGEAPSIKVLAGDSEKSQAQWYRDLEAFRVAFPGETSPDRLARELLRQRAGRSAVMAFSAECPGWLGV